MSMGERAVVVSMGERAVVVSMGESSSSEYG